MCDAPIGSQESKAKFVIKVTAANNSFLVTQQYYSSLLSGLLLIGSTRVVPLFLAIIILHLVSWVTQSFIQSAACISDREGTRIWFLVAAL